MSTERSVNIFRGVAAKIYGVVGLCLLALVSVSGVAIYQFVKIGHELETIAEFDAPLTAALTEVTIHQLEQAILFERAMRVGEIMGAHPEQRAGFKEAVEKFEYYDAKVDKEIHAVQELLSHAKDFEQEAESLALFEGVHQELEMLGRVHLDYAAHAREAFALVREQRLEELLTKLPRIVEEEDLLDSRIEALLLEVEKFTIKAARKADAHEQAALTQMIVISIIAIILGGVASWVVVRRFVTGPLNEVSGGVSALCRGDLTVEVAVRRNDEIGVIASGLMQFRENARQVARMSEERAEQDAKAAEARHAMMSELQREFGAVVAGAVAGQFSARVKETFADAELNELAEGVNRLLGVVEAGIDETGRVMRRLAEGDLQERMEGDFQGALAALQGDVNDTIERLGALVGEIETTTTSLLGNSENIASGSSALASRAEQQASSLQETAATMEEMSATVRSSANNSSQASALAAEASSEAAAGGAIVAQAIGAVSEIEASSAKISDIITVIDGIAFQTNLLALNAAVEAARAGDAGKGFAVVASEVRALAQRSSEAASDIKGLIETSAAKVGEGVRLVTNAGGSLEKIVASIGEVEDVIRNIATSGAEQATGVQEISSTVSHLDEITQSNSTLAEEGASNALALAGDATKLKELIGFFGARQAHGALLRAAG